MDDIVDQTVAEDVLIAVVEVDVVDCDVVGVVASVVLYSGYVSIGLAPSISGTCAVEDNVVDFDVVEVDVVEVDVVEVDVVEVNVVDFDVVDFDVVDIVAIVVL